MACSCQLLRASHPGWPCTHHSNALACTLTWKLRFNPAFFPSFIDDRVLDGLNADRIVINI